MPFAAAGALVLGLSGPASAAQLVVTAKGTIPPTCAMTATKDFGSSNLNAAGSAIATASVNCNQFFKLTATSQKGAIKSSAVASGKLTNSLPYSLKADLVLDTGSNSTTCPSSSLVAGQASCPLSPASSTGLTSSGQIATNRTTTLTVSWSPPALPTMLAPGSYSDIITLTIASVP